MSARHLALDAVAPEGSEHSLEFDGQTRELVVGIGAVDELDVAAELESNGITDHGCRRHLNQSLFTVAERVFHRSGGATRSTPQAVRRGGQGLSEAFWRAVVLFGGVALAGMVIVCLGVQPPAVGIATAVTWVGGSIVGAVVWAHRSAGDLAGGLRAAGRWGAIIIVLTAVAVGLSALRWPSWSALAAGGFVIGLLIYGVLAAVAIATPRVGRSAWVMAVGAGLAVAVWFAGLNRSIVVGIAVVVLVFLGIAVVSVWPEAIAVRSLTPPRPFRADLAAALPAAIQSLVLAGGLLLIGEQTRGEFRALTIGAAVAGIAIADPLLTSLRSHLRHRLTQVWHHDELSASRVGWGVLGCSLVTASVTIAIPALRDGTIHVGAPTVALAGFGALAGLSSAFRMFARPWTAVASALPALIPGLVLGSGPLVVAICVAVALGVGSIVVASVLRDPRAFM